MNFTKAGVILNTENYRDCVDFYGSILGLPILQQFGNGSDEITVFSLGSSYLMVEHGGTAHPEGKSNSTCPTKFRFNVRDVDASASELREKGVALTVLHHDWGTTAEFSDPDGNRCALRSDEGFGS
ncbi:VOC family protein [Roseovarius amoyensis]|uniref:VOC family protein n=1 Tax=Roseovarius amoyensis TaxID=2211448 RepID=UPI000DBE3D3D|nr:VOC family protein [Roseovarius amoyensis]